MKFEDLEVGSEVWSVIDPVYGRLQAPVLDTVLEILPNKVQVFLKNLNHFNPASSDPFYKDKFANYINIRYLYKTYEEAVEVLMESYETDKTKLLEALSRTESILTKLKLK